MLYTSLRLVSESLLHHQADVGNEVTNLIPLTLVSQCTNQSPLSIEIIGQSFFGRVFFPRVDAELFNLSSFETTDQAVKVDNNSFTGFYDLFTRHMSFPIAFHRVESTTLLGSTHRGNRWGRPPWGIWGNSPAISRDIIVIMSRDMVRTMCT